jgi:hypothetical protein
MTTSRAEPPTSRAREPYRKPESGAIPPAPESEGASRRRPRSDDRWWQFFSCGLS